MEEKQKKTGSDRGRDMLTGNEGMQKKGRRERWREAGRQGSGVVLGRLKASRSQRFPLNLEPTANALRLLQKAEWLIIMAACFHLVPSASLRAALWSGAVTGELTCGQAYNLQLQFRHLAAAP